MNFGQGEFGFTFWPIAKSTPDPEYSTVFSDPIAFDALSITVLASCANTTPYSSIAIATAAMHFLLMLPPLIFTAAKTRPRNWSRLLRRTVFHSYLDM